MDFQAQEIGQKPIDLKPADWQDASGRAILDNSTKARTMQERIGKSITIFGYLVTLKPVRTVKKEMMYFGCFIDHEGNYFDTIHFPNSLKNFPFRGVGVYKLTGQVVDEFGFVSLQVQQMVKMPRKMDPRALNG